MRGDQKHRARWQMFARLMAVTLFAGACTSSDPELGDPANTSVLVEDTPAAEAGDEAASQEVDDPTLILERWAEELSGGAVVSIARNGGEVSTFAAGASDTVGTALTERSLFRVGSVSKSFVATMVLQLAEEGSIALDDLATIHLDPAIDAAWLDGVTIRHLLSHASGIPNYTEQSDYFRSVFSDAERAWTPLEVLDLVGGLEPDFAPGEQNVYSNSNFIVLGLVLEAVTDTSLEANLQSRIVQPLGLADTTFASTDVAPVTGYSTFLPGDSSEAEAYTSIETSAWAAGALVSTGPDLATFIRALAAGELVSAETFAEMTAGTNDTGFGLGILSMPLPTEDGIGHGGTIFGFTSLIGVDVATGDLLVIVSNDDFGDSSDLAQRILRAW